MTAIADGCAVCRRAAAAEAPPGGWVHQDATWLAGVMPAAAVPGWLVLQPRVHVEAFADLPAAALAGFGGLVAALTGALTAVTGARRVYLGAFGEQLPHWHLLLAVAPDHLPPARRGPVLLAEFADLVDVAAAERVARRVAERLAAPHDHLSQSRLPEGAAP